MPLNRVSAAAPLPLNRLCNMNYNRLLFLFLHTGHGLCFLEKLFLTVLSQMASLSHSFIRSLYKYLISSL